MTLGAQLAAGCHRSVAKQRACARRLTSLRAPSPKRVAASVGVAGCLDPTSRALPAQGAVAPDIEAGNSALAPTALHFCNVVIEWRNIHGILLLDRVVRARDSCRGIIATRRR